MYDKQTRDFGIRGSFSRVSGGKAKDAVPSKEHSAADPSISSVAAYCPMSAPVILRAV